MSHKLSQKLVQSPAFKWMPGMLAGLPNDEGKIVVWMRIVSVRRNAITASVDRYEGINPRVFLFEREHWDKTPPAIDPDDPGTVGCLLALLKEAVSACLVCMGTGEQGAPYLADPKTGMHAVDPCSCLKAVHERRWKVDGEALAQALISLGADQ